MRHAVKLLIGFAMFQALFGCAKSPESIAPSYISASKYDALKCGEIADETGRISEALSRASMQQENARTNDTVGVLLIGLPVSSMSGDNIAPEVARLKGEAEALRAASLKKHCQ